MHDSAHFLLLPECRPCKNAPTQWTLPEPRALSSRYTPFRKTYGATVAVSDISFQVREGEIFGLIGPNGAGKTTTLECVEGVRRPDRGAISILGLDPIRDVYQLQNRIGVQLQQAHLQKPIKVWEAVDFWASLYPKTVACSSSSGSPTSEMPGS